MKRALGVVLAAAVVFGLMSAPVNAAKRRTFTSTLRNIRDHTDGDSVVAISGRVSSQKAQCIAGREIRVRLEGANIAYGSATSDGAGNFVVEGLGPRDQVYRISLLTERVGGFRCGPDTVVDELG
jgi:hypothetical protein